MSTLQVLQKTQPVVDSPQELLSQLLFALSSVKGDGDVTLASQQELRTDPSIPLFIDDRVVIGYSFPRPEVLTLDIVESAWFDPDDDRGLEDDWPESEYEMFEYIPFELNLSPIGSGQSFRVELGADNPYALGRFHHYLSPLDKPLHGLLSARVASFQSALDANFIHRSDLIELKMIWGVTTSSISLDDNLHCSRCEHELIDGQCPNSLCPMSDLY